jgi:hypothetical protein
VAGEAKLSSMHKLGAILCPLVFNCRSSIAEYLCAATVRVVIKYLDWEEP